MPRSRSFFMPFAGGDVRRAFPSGKRGLVHSVTFFPGQGLDTAHLVRRAGWSCKGYVRRSVSVAGGESARMPPLWGRRHARGGEEAGSGGKRADKAKDSPEAALYVKAGRGETPVKISWDKKVEISLQRYVKKLLMARCQPVCPKRKKAGTRKKAVCRTGCPEKRHEKSADDRAFFILFSKRDQMTMRRTAMSLLPQ